MPNWCNNHVSLIGDKADIQRLEQALTRKLTIANEAESFWWPVLADTDGESNCTDRFLFARALDYKDLGCDEPQENFGYFHAIGHMGTKWDPDFEMYVSSGGTEMTLYFNSAWSPPLRAMVILGKKYSLDIDHVYEEPGCDFGGRLTYCAKTNDVQCAQTTYLIWQYVCYTDEFDTIEFLIESELGDWTDEEYKEQVREESKSWPKDESQFVKGPFPYEEFLRAELDLRAHPITYPYAEPGL